MVKELFSFFAPEEFMLKGTPCSASYERQEDFMVALIMNVENTLSPNFNLLAKTLKAIESILAFERVKEVKYEQVRH